MDQKKTVVYSKNQEYENAIVMAKKQIKEIKRMGNTHDGDGFRYKGKGLIQLTWRNTYENYFSYVKKTNPIPEAMKNKTIDEILNRKEDDMSRLLGSSLFYTADSAGWFWSVYKQTGPYYLADAADYDGDTTVAWLGKQMSNIKRITWIVNGGTNHFQERKDSYNEIRDKIFIIKSVCVNFDKIK